MNQIIVASYQNLQTLNDKFTHLSSAVTQINAIVDALKMESMPLSYVLSLSETSKPLTTRFLEALNKESEQPILFVDVGDYGTHFVTTSAANPVVVWKHVCDCKPEDVKFECVLSKPIPVSFFDTT